MFKSVYRYMNKNNFYQLVILEQDENSGICCHITE